MRRLLYALIVFFGLPCLAHAQTTTLTIPPISNVSVLVLPASGVNGAGVATCPQGIATTSTDCLVLPNNTAATAGVPVQQAPRLRFRSNVWNTTAVAANNTDDFFVESVPVSGTTPSGLLKFGSSLNGGAATYPATLTSAGSLTALASFVAGVGSNAATSFGFAGALNHGMYMAAGTNGPVIAANGVDALWCSAAPYCQMRSDGGLRFSGTTTITGTADTYLTRPAAGQPLFSGVSAPMQIRTTQTTVPTCTTNCGSPGNVCAGTDTAMTCTMGTTPASGFVIAFNGTWATAPSCTVQMALAGMVVGKQALTAATTTGQITIVTNGTAPVAGDKYHIHCFGIS